MRMTRFLSVFTLPFIVAACVTINVYFPAAAAEKAADRIIEEVYGKNPPAAPAQPETKPQSHNDRDYRSWLAFGTRVLDVIVPPARAEANIDTDTPAIRAITASMSARQGQLDPFYASGAIGLTGDGMLSVRDDKAVALKDRNRLKQLVADDNRDRAALYREVAAANGHPEWEADVRATFARRWIAKAPAGWWYQEGGAWKQK